MAEVYPRLTDDDLRRLPSQGEARLYRACRDQLDDGYLVLYSVPFIRPKREGGHGDGEADFVVFDERGGLIVVEVKGGGLALDPASGKWHSTDRYGVRHDIKDPFRQATGQKHEMLKHLVEHPKWRGGHVAAGHAVFLPDIDDASALTSPQRPAEIIGGRGDLADVRGWLRRVSSYWSGQSGSSSPLGKAGVEFAKDLFCRPVEVRPLLSSLLAADEAQRIRLTEEQARVLRGLGLRRRAALAGGAGTGKTLLALQKAREVADAGYRTALLCYNRPLADHLNRVLGEHPKLLAMSFHQLCDWRIRQVREALGRDLLVEAEAAYPGGDKFDLHFPFALALSTEVMDDPFDAMVVDEGQDFGEEYWPPLELSLRDEAESLLYVFYDANQAVYKRASTFPIDEQPFLLTVNCRNTRPIHVASYRFYTGDPIDPPDNAGAPVERVCAPSLEAQARRLHALIVRLLNEEHILTSDIVVLVADGSRKAHYYAALVERPLPGAATYAIERHVVPDSVTVDTVHRFKGLEAAVVFLWGLDGLDVTADHRTLYVGLSRAKSRLYVVGSEAICDAVTESHSLASL